ncbi:MAG: rubrerythrin [Thermoleophilia bacterium]|nr:rubrerythrin [Thermoleophilia bacterium]
MDVIKLMEKAIENERQARDMYHEGAAAAEDPETRSIFEQLARWEEDHERILRERLATLRLIKGQQ